MTRRKWNISATLLNANAEHDCVAGQFSSKVNRRSFLKQFQILFVMKRLTFEMISQVAKMNLLRSLLHNVHISISCI